MLALFSYLQFLLKSTNQHGVHSPFVYNFVTKCLYNNQLIPKKELKHFSATLSNLQVHLLLKIIRYFSAYHILTDDISIKNLSNIDTCCCISTSRNRDTFDLIFVNHPPANTDLRDYLPLLHNDSILVINNIHQKEKEPLWQQLIADERVTAYVDVYVQGYVLVRKEQGKEGFYIRP